MKVYLDDIRDAYIGWERTRTVPETIELLKTGKVTHLSLDHDLTIQQTLGYDDKELTGYDVLVWIEEQVATTDYMPPEHMVVHSMNPSGKVKMEAAIRKIWKMVRDRTSS